MCEVVSKTLLKNQLFFKTTHCFPTCALFYPIVLKRKIITADMWNSLLPTNAARIRSEQKTNKGFTSLFKYSIIKRTNQNCNKKINITINRFRKRPRYSDNKRTRWAQASINKSAKQIHLTSMVFYVHAVWTKAR